MSNHTVQQRGAGTIQTQVEGDLKSNEQFDCELSAEMIKRTNKLHDTTIDIAIRLKQAREFIAWSANHLRTSWLDWQTEAGTAVKDITQDRMAFDRESKAIIACAKDVTSFFNDSQYMEALNHLKETVTTLDRFAELKRNGTLDAFADFILKISCK